MIEFNALTISSIVVLVVGALFPKHINYVLNKANHVSVEQLFCDLWSGNVGSMSLLHYTIWYLGVLVGLLIIIVYII